MTVNPCQRRSTYCGEMSRVFGWMPVVVKVLQQMCLYDWMACAEQWKAKQVTVDRVSCPSCELNDKKEQVLALPERGHDA